jgi:flagellar hook-length control protein FliK
LKAPSIGTVLPNAGPSSRAAIGKGSEGKGEDNFSRMLKGSDRDPAARSLERQQAAQRQERSEAARREGRRDQASGGRVDEDGTDAGQTTEATTATRVEPEARAEVQLATPDADAGWPPPGLSSLLGEQPPAPPPASPQLGPLTGPLQPPAAELAQGAGPALPGEPAGLRGPATPASVSALQIRMADAAALEASTANLRGTEPVAAQTNSSSAAALDSATPTPSFAQVLGQPPATGAPAGPLAPPPASAAPAPQPNLHGGAFADEVGTHVQWLAGQKISHAHIRITPDHLGPVEIRLQLDGDRISAEFTSAQAEVRQALESGLPRLREMLGQHGLELAHAGVGHDQAPAEGRARRAGSVIGPDGMAETEADLAPVQTRAIGLVDAYA